MTPYLQAGDIGIYRELKDNLSDLIHKWKHSDCIEYTKSGNPIPPSQEIVRSWINDSWRQVSTSNVKNCIQSAGFASNFEDWHITKHDVYGNQFRSAWLEAGTRDIDLEILENIPQADEIETIDEFLHDLEVDN